MSSDDNVIRLNFGKKSNHDATESSQSNHSSADTQNPPAPPIDFATQQKLRFFRSAIDMGTVMVTLNATRKDVTVPTNFKKWPQLNLNFDYRYQIDDFEFDEVGVRASLSFGGVDSWCNIPWSAVLRISNQSTGEVREFTPQ